MPNFCQSANAILGIVEGKFVSDKGAMLESSVESEDHEDAVVERERVVMVLVVVVVVVVVAVGRVTSW